MNLFSQAVQSIRNSFASYVEVTNATGITVNPISRSLENMNVRPKFKNIDGIDYLAFGANDDVDLMIDRVMYKSSTHSGIITKKAKMISGTGLAIDGEALKESKQPRLRTLAKHAGGANVSLYELVTKAAYEYSKSGAVGLKVTFGNQGKQSKIPEGIVLIDVIPARNMRFVRPSGNDGIYKEIVVKKSFKQGADVPKAVKYPIFDPFSTKQKEAILYIKNPYSVLDTYGTPNWIGAFNYIEADYDFGLTIENAAKNGFAPKTHVTMIGRNMSKEEKRLAASNIQNRLSGSKGDQVVTSFVAKPEEKPIIDTIQTQNLDKTIESMSRLNDAKILTAHNITSPTLFGVMTTGQTMGGTGTEMLSAFKVFRATEIIPDRRMLIGAFESLFAVTELADAIFEVEEEDVSVEFQTQPKEGGNADKKNPDIKKKDPNKPNDK